ncbi:RICIN domain-containing protein [Catenovulum adriaticum]|uniref:RICIN domain-containing protein n=1 Tax=Catenovulum adriaticum TaxID=2984846 RepID=A0ABY7ASZ2_9ALTE|nr:RICIN domain-containing protein [Catenovulum sp. TS8]WAJ71791.1 RICIN domain-containing protein [Catenovulum sp. TS8]
MKKALFCFGLILFIFSQSLKAQIVTPNWPVAQGYLQNSNYYTVKVKQGNQSFITVKTWMTESQNELMTSGQNGLFLDRTFNFSSFSFDPAGGPVTVRVIKSNIAGNISAGAANVEVINADGGLTKINNNTIDFKLNNPKYVSVNIKLSDNQKSYNVHKVVKNMLMIFADPIDSDLNEPNGANKVVYSPSVSQTQLRNADIIVFRDGYHDVVSRFGNDGVRFKAGAKIWLAPGAVVAGSFIGVDGNNNTGFNVAPNAEVYGRGLLYMGEHRNNPNNPNSGPFWRPNDPDYVHSGALSEAISLNGSKNVEIRGLIIGDIMWHGIVVGENALIERVKIWGWHANNDGMRPGNNSLVRNNFIRPVDDAFYAFSMTGENNLIWPSYNGALITAGWVGKYHTGGIELNNTTVIYPEWTGKGNNNGIVASQLGDTQECTGITINNMEIWGDTIAILNLKPSSRRHESPNWSGQSSFPGVRNVAINDLTINGSLKAPNLVEHDGAFDVSNIDLHNIKITGFANRYLNNNDRTNSQLFEGNNLTNGAKLNITANNGTGGVANGTYFIEAKHSGKYVEVGGFSTSNGGNIQQWDSQQGTQKQWQITLVSGNYYKLVNVLSAKAMDIQNFSTANGGNVHQWGFSGSDNQLFSIESTGNGYVQIKGKQSGKCLDIAFNNQDNGANVQQWGCSGNDNQSFRLINAN